MTVINEAKMELESIRTAAEESATQCAASIKVAKDGLAILEADLAISIKVENMTNCDEEETTLFECGSGYARRLHFAGKAADLQHFRSATAVSAMQRVAKMAMGKRVTTKFEQPKAILTKTHKKVRGSKGKPKPTVASKLKEHKKVSLLQQEPEQPPPSRDDPISNETFANISDLVVAEMPEPQSYDPNELMKKCSVSGSSSCPMIRDALSQLTSEVRWARDQAQSSLDELESECARMAAEYKAQTEDWEMILEQNNVKFATSTGRLNTAEEAIRLKVEEANGLIDELTVHRQECADKIREGAETLCGIKTIRQELYQMNGENPFIQDCEVSEWEESQCSVECGGGERELTRGIVVQPTGGAVCPPLVEKEACNAHPCPIDCVMGDWSGWSACSKDCGGGVMQRSRIPVTE